MKMKVHFQVFKHLFALLTILIQIGEGIMVKHNNYEDSWLTKLIKDLPVQKQIRWRQTEKCKCGLTHKTNHSERIVGGFVSKNGAWPWMGAIVYMRDSTPKIVCGTSIINRRYLISAAHCGEYLKTQGMDKFQVFLGTNDLNDKDAVVPELEAIIMHPKYDTKTKVYDVALLKLKTPLKYSARVSPICISPQSGAPYKDKEAIVVGWGSLMFGGVATTMQMQTMVNVTSNKICAEKYLKSEEPVQITPMMMCASAPGSDSCQGDSGSPLFLKRKGKSSAIFEQIGIVSFGSGCADQRYPGVYVRLGKVLSWIRTVTNDAVYCNMK